MPPIVPAVSIVIPCRNEASHIETCLHSILAQAPPPGGFEVIVADGMSDDGTRSILKQLLEKVPHLRLIDNLGLNVSSGLNLAIKAARGRVIMRIDAHTEYASDYIRQCLAVLRETGADNVGGPACTKSTGYVQASICAAYHSAFSVGGARFHNMEYEGLVDTVPYGCWPAEVFEKIGLFDEELIRNQDDEFNLRLTNAGGKVWQSPRIRSWYRPRGSLSALFRQYMQYGYWKVRVIQKHKIPASLRHVVPGCFVFLMIMLPLVSLLWTAVAWVWVGLIGTYSVCNLAVSFLTAAHRGWKLLAVLPLVFACYHLGYGYGFLCGIWDLVILRRRPNLRYTKITRALTINPVKQPWQGNGVMPADHTKENSP